jgi:hypothetical protein
MLGSSMQKSENPDANCQNLLKTAMIQKGCFVDDDYGDFDDDDEDDDDDDEGEEEEERICNSLRIA